MRFAATTAPLMVLALVGCSKQGAAPAPEGGASLGVAAQDGGGRSAPTPAASSASASAAPVSEASRSATLPPAIPLALRGRWGMVPADCTSTRGDAKGLLTVGARELKFYESLGTLLVTRERGDTRLAGTFAYEGEGMEWRREVTLEVGPGGKVLVLREAGDDAPPGPQTYTRCDT